MTNQTIQKDKIKKVKTFGKTCVVLLPSETSKIILQYEPSLRISVITPTKNRKVLASRSPTQPNVQYWEEEFDLNVPTLILSGLFVGSSGLNRISDFSTMRSHNYSIWAVDDSKKDGIYAAPYEVGNVHLGGNICFGTVEPKTLRQAHNLFWSIPFTDHMWQRRGERCNSCPSSKKTHGYNDLHQNNHKYDKNHSPIHGEWCKCSKEIFHQHYCLGMQIGLVKYAAKRTSLIKAFSKKSQEEQEKSIGTLPEKCGDCPCCESIIKDKQSCKCTARHKLTCNCRYGNCRCPCDCNCCSKKCKCQCYCPCCSNTCYCPCSCYKDKFIKHLKGYDYSKDLKWSNMTIAVCGEKYYAKPTNAAGLLLSSSPDIMVEIPKKYWREYTISTRDKTNYSKINKESHSFVVGLGNPNPDGETWDFEVGGVKFNLPESKLVFK